MHCARCAPSSARTVFSSIRIAPSTSKVPAHQDALVRDSDRPLLLDSESPRAQLKRQRVFIDLFQEPAPQRICHRERTSDDPLRHRVPLRPIAVHRCPSLFICVGSFVYPTCQQIRTERLTLRTAGSRRLTAVDDIRGGEKSWRSAGVLGASGTGAFHRAARRRREHGTKRSRDFHGVRRYRRQGRAGLQRLV